MAKPKKKRAKKYDPRKHHIAYLDILDISANKGLSEAVARRIELDARIHLQAFRSAPTFESWAYIVGLLLMADRLSYDVEEGPELRRDFEAAWKQMDDAWRIWREQKVIATANLDFADALLGDLVHFFTHFTYKEVEAARIYVSNHHLMPVRRAQEKGLSA